MNFETLLYETDGRIATITLNRPERLNTIVPPMPDWGSYLTGMWL